MDINKIMKDLQKILQKVEKIASQLNKPQPVKQQLSDYISEEDAKKHFKRGTTWFWQLRKDGLPYTKLRGEVFYKIADIIAWLEKHKR